MTGRVEFKNELIGCVPETLPFEITAWPHSVEIAEWVRATVLHRSALLNCGPDQVVFPNHLFYEHNVIRHGRPEC
jgi:hypothetical protein